MNPAHHPQVSPFRLVVTGPVQPEAVALVDEIARTFPSSTHRYAGRSPTAAEKSA